MFLKDDRRIIFLDDSLWKKGKQEMSLLDKGKQELLSYLVVYDSPEFYLGIVSSAWGTLSQDKKMYASCSSQSK